MFEKNVPKICNLREIKKKFLKNRKPTGNFFLILRNWRNIGKLNFF